MKQAILITDQIKNVKDFRSLIAGFSEDIEIVNESQININTNDWDHFISEQFIDELPLPSSTSSGIRDRFFLMIKYYKDGKPGYFGRKICLTDSQDKSEEEIIAAVKFYYKQFEKAAYKIEDVK